MQKSIEIIRQKFQTELHNAVSSADIEELKVRYLGRKGPIQDLMKQLREVSSEERPRFGKEINDLKEEITERIAQHHDSLISKEEAKQLETEKEDITLPGLRHFRGNKHIVTKVMDELLTILMQMGFSVQYGPDIESDYYNFEALNFPPDHPARDMQDTFYISSNMLLRTQTTNIQVRIMEIEKPPIRIISPGKAFRNEAITARSHVFFHQIEALYIDRNVTFADLFATMKEFFSKFFNCEIITRNRPSYFPFVEPGLEVDVACLACKGNGCHLCKETGWLEVAGAGMVHPEVLKIGGIDPEIYNGFAWGLGVERLAMLKYGISDIRLFTENDLRFLNQFSAV